MISILSIYFFTINNARFIPTLRRSHVFSSLEQSGLPHQYQFVTLITSRGKYNFFTVLGIQNCPQFLENTPAKVHKQHWKPI